MKEADKAWIEFAQEVVNASKRELGTKRIGKNPRYGVATRTLQRSLTYKLGKTKGQVDSIELKASGKAKYYAAFIHWGVNGNQVRHGSPFSFRRKQPPTDEVRKWMKVKPVRLRDPKTGAFIKQTEGKLNSAAFLIARSIKRKGIPGVRYFVNGFDVAFRKKGDEFAQAVGNVFAKKLVAKVNPIEITLNA